MQQDPLRPLIDGWRKLYLSVAAPDRSPGWDALVITASNCSQAEIYRHELNAMKRRGLIPPATNTFVIEDPQGKRVGSGGATLQALRILNESLDVSIDQLKILLIHAGGDSRRMPWASVNGKAFIPVPLLAEPDDPPPSLLAHLLALTAAIPSRLSNGMLLALSGDVIPLGSLESLDWPTDGLVAVATARPLSIAAKHGAFVTDSAGYCLELLQKANQTQLMASGAVRPNGTALIDTGIWAIAGMAFNKLIKLSTHQDDPINAILKDGRELSLYEEISAVAVRGRANWLRDRPIGNRLLSSLSGTRLRILNPKDLLFLHLGTTSEYLDQVSRSWHGLLSKRVMAETGPESSLDAVILASRIEGASVGSGSVVAGSTLRAGCTVGRRCVIFGADGESSFHLPDNHCLWQIPINGMWATAWCGVDDNPKDPFHTATLGNRPISEWIKERNLDPLDLWENIDDRCLWTAKLFPASPHPMVHSSLDWMLGEPSANPSGKFLWQDSPRYSLSELAASSDSTRLLNRRSDLLDRIALRAIFQTTRGATDSNVSRLVKSLSAGAISTLPPAADKVSPRFSRARQLWLKSDLLAAGSHPSANLFRDMAWPEIATSVGMAIFYSVEPVGIIPKDAWAKCALPARVDFAGGWSDTPPYSLEHPASVLNMAIKIDDQPPIFAEAKATDEEGMRIFLDDIDYGIHSWSSIDSNKEYSLSDPIVLLRACAAVCGYGSRVIGGLSLRAMSRLPKGSGLGGSSILAAATVTALQRIARRPDDWETVSNLVLSVEQRLRTGGGWQDQIGGLIPGIKLVSSTPKSPIKITIDPVPLDTETIQKLSEQIIIADTGITRLARNVLQRVMGSYLARDQRVIKGISRLADLANEGRDLLSNGDIDGFGELIKEVWGLNQSLDPLCSNSAVDALFDRTEELCRGWKLCGAGGGGFALAVCPAGKSQAMKEVLQKRGAKIASWSMAT